VRYQQTRLQNRVAAAGDRLAIWAANPWRRLSLLLIILLAAFVLGSGVGMVTGTLSAIDQLGALICVAALELAVRLRSPLRRRTGDPLGMQMLDMARMGLLYGLLLDGFKIL
jgi:hypothetical protein